MPRFWSAARRTFAPPFTASASGIRGQYHGRKAQRKAQGHVSIINYRHASRLRYEHLYPQAIPSTEFVRGAVPFYGVSLQRQDVLMDGIDDVHRVSRFARDHRLLVQMTLARASESMLEVWTSFA